MLVLVTVVVDIIAVLVVSFINPEVVDVITVVTAVSFALLVSDLVHVDVDAVRVGALVALVEKYMGRVVVDVLLLLLPLLALELHSGELNLTSVRNTEAPVACKPALSNADPKLEPWSEAIATSAARKLVDRSRSAIPFTTTALPRLRKRSPTWRAPAMSPLLASSTVRRLCQASLSASD